MNEHSENFNKELENIKKSQTELKNTMTKIKATWGGIESRLDNSRVTDQWTKRQSSRKYPSWAEKKKIEKKRTENNLRNHWDNINNTNIPI